MKKVLMVLLAAVLLIGFTGCDTILPLLGYGNLSILPGPYITEDANGFMESATFSIKSEGLKETEVWLELYRVSADAFSIDEVFFEGAVNVTADATTPVTITREMIRTWVDLQQRRIPLTYGDINVKLDPRSELRRELDRDDNTVKVGQGLVINDDLMEPDDTVGDAYGPVAIGDSPVLTHYPEGDADFISFPCEAGRTYKVWTESAAYPAGTQNTMAFYDSNQVLVAPGAGYTASDPAAEFASLSAFICPLTGTYTVKISAVDPDAIGAYVVHFEETVP